MLTLCADMCADVCADMWIDVWVDVCVGMCTEIDMCVDVYGTWPIGDSSEPVICCVRWYVNDAAA